MSFEVPTASCPWPVVQAPMAGAQGHRLAAAVCQAGGLGSLPAAMWSAQQLREQVAQLRLATDRAFNLNFFCHQPQPVDDQAQARWRQRLAPYHAELGLEPAAAGSGPARRPFDAEAAELVEALRPAVVSFHFGLPAPALLARVRRSGAWVWSSATTLDEGRWLQQQGVDAVIVQGLEAGGHRGHFLRPDLDLSGQAPLAELLPALRSALNLPLIAAGGVASADDVQRCLALGASAVQVGTAYLLCDEADTSAVHRAALRQPPPADGHDDTALTNLFSGRPARGIVNRLMVEHGPLAADVPAFPQATAALAALRTAAEAQGSGAFSPLWSGSRRPGPAGCTAAAELTRRLLAAAVGAGRVW